MNKAVIVVLFLLLFFSIVAEAGKVETISNLSYLEKDLVVVEGNITLVFNYSTYNNQSNVKIIRLFYEPMYDFTIMKVESLSINYSYDFVNDTKYYYYNDSVYQNDTYIISVDYSSIAVPTSPIEHLQMLLAEKNQTIAALQSRIENMTSYNQSISDELDTIIAERDALLFYKNSTKDMVEDYPTLFSERNNLTADNALLKSSKHLLEGDVRSLESSLENATNPLALSYSKGGKTAYIFNISWFVIGGIIFLAFWYVFTTKKEPKTLASAVNSLNPFSKKSIGEKSTEPISWPIEEEKQTAKSKLPLIEQQYLSKAKVPEKVDKILEKSEERRKELDMRRLENIINGE